MGAATPLAATPLVVPDQELRPDGFPDVESVRRRWAQDEREMPVTVTGVRRLVVVPSPSWPLKFHPQHLTVPLVSTAHVWVPPVEISTMLVSPLTVIGTSASVSVPSPRRPLLLLHQSRLSVRFQREVPG